MIKETEKLLSRCYCTHKAQCESVPTHPSKETSANHSSDRHIACESDADTNGEPSDGGGGCAEERGLWKVEIKEKHTTVVGFGDMGQQEEERGSTLPISASHLGCEQ